MFEKLYQSNEKSQSAKKDGLEEKEACIIIDQEDLNKHKLEDTINYLLSNNNAIKKLENNINKFAKPMASNDIANKIINLIK